MKTEVSQKRWEEAQEYEKKYWEKRKNTNSKGYFEKSNKMKQELSNFISLTSKSKILQIGCGPDDVIHQWEEGERYGIDPQMDNYKQFGLLKEKGVKNIQGIGEKLPFKDNFFDLIIINNVLDHCQNPKKVLEEIKRCLRKNGLLYTETNVRPLYLLPLLKMVWWTKISTARGHPYLFTPKTLRNLINSCNLKVIEEHSNRQRFRLKYLFSLRKFVQYIIEYQYVFICRKK